MYFESFAHLDAVVEFQDLLSIIMYNYVSSSACRILNLSHCYICSFFAFLQK